MVHQFPIKRHFFKKKYYTPKHWKKRSENVFYNIAGARFRRGLTSSGNSASDPSSFFFEAAEGRRRRRRWWWWLWFSPTLVGGGVGGGGREGRADAEETGARKTEGEKMVGETMVVAFLHLSSPLLFFISALSSSSSLRTRLMPLLSVKE